MRTKLSVSGLNKMALSNTFRRASLSFHRLVIGVSLFALSSVAAQAQWFQVRNSGGSATPGHPASTIYVGDSGLTFTCDAWGTLEGAWGGSQVWIHTGSDIHNGTAGAATSFTSSDAKSNTSGRFTTAGTWYWGMRIQYNRSGGTTVGWYNRNTANWENAYGTPDANLTVTVAAIPSPTSQTATATSSSNINLTWTRASTSSARDTVIFRSTSATPPTLSGNTAYAVNDVVGGATCIYNGSGTSTSSGSLAASTQYYYHFFAVNNNYYSSASTANATTQAAATPTLNAVTLSSALSSTYPSASSGVGFVASGSTLSSNITATAQSGYEVSTSLSSGYGSSVSVATGTTVYVRLAASRAAGNYNGATAVVLSSTGATSQNVTTSSSGNTVSQKALTISGASATNRAYDATTTVAVSGGTLVGVESGDTVTLSSASATGTVASATVGNAKSVTVTGYSISGGSSANYSLTQPTGLTVNITKATPTKLS